MRTGISAVCDRTATSKVCTCFERQFSDGDCVTRPYRGGPYWAVGGRYGREVAGTGDMDSGRYGGSGRGIHAVTSYSTVRATGHADIRGKGIIQEVQRLIIAGAVPEGACGGRRQAV